MSYKAWYNQDADYNTNARSYMDYLARHNKFMKTLVEDYEVFQEVVTEELKQIKFNAETEVEDILLNWLDDGTLYRIINDEVFGNKADTEWVNNHLNLLREDIENDLNEKIDTVQTRISDFSDDIDTTIQTFKSGVNNQISNLSKSIPINHVYSDKYDTLQDAFNEAENGVLHIKKGTYLITTPIKIKSNTTVYAYESIFRRNADIDHLFINDSNGSKGEYTANEKISIYGGVFDGAGGSFVDKCTLIAMGHSNRIKIIDSTFINLVDWHMIEINACQDVRIENCLFKDYGSSAGDIGTEMIQIDVAYSTKTFPWFPPYDHTTCDNITIKNNRFVNGQRGVGTHSSVENKEHTNINILDNVFLNMNKEAIYGMDWAFTTIKNNVMRNVQKGIYITAQGRNVFNHFITENYLSGKDNRDSRGIHIAGINGGLEVSSGNITNNKIKNFGGHGIGVDFSNQWVIQGNDVNNGGRTGIFVYGSAQVIVSNNTSHGNSNAGTPDYDISVINNSANVIVESNVVDNIQMESTVIGIFKNNIVKTARVNIMNEITKSGNFINGILEE